MPVGVVVVMVLAFASLVGAGVAAGASVPLPEAAVPAAAETVRNYGSGRCRATR